MNRLLTRYLLTALYVYASLVLFQVGWFDNAISLVYLVFALFILDITLKPLAYLIGLPISLLSLGAFVFVIQAALLLLADKMVKGLYLGGFWPALLIAVLVHLTMNLVPNHKGLQIKTH